MDENGSFGDRKRQRREAPGLTQDALAQRLDCTPSTIRGIETDERPPSLETIELLATALHTPEAEHEAFLLAGRGEHSVGLPDQIPFAQAERRDLASRTTLLRGTLTFLLTDVEGSTAVWERQQDAAHVALIQHDDIIETLVTEHGGRIVRPRGEGDSRFAVFERASDAVSAAATIQHALQEATWPTQKPLRIRIALHTGEADLRAGDYYGSAVNRCARIRTLAHGGQILLSQTTYNIVRDQLGHGKLAELGARTLGQLHLKDLAQPEEVFQIVMPGLPDAFPPLRTTPVADRNRGRMLAKVRQFWIAGVLEHVLRGVALITPGLERRPDLVTNPWAELVEQPQEHERTMAPDTTIIQAYDSLGGELLILGAPGAGKTILMLELARELLTRAEHDAAHPLPVVFNLASWSTRRQPLTNWLIDELNMRYDVPRSIGRAWVEAGEILPLLDGLDEVSSEHRAQCAEAINAFHRYAGLQNLLVCCRTADYEMLGTRLNLQSAVLIQPLRDEQIAAYVRDGGDRLNTLTHILQEDAELREMARSPLMLNIMALAYADGSPPSPPVGGSIDEPRDRVFTAYVDRMFERKPSAAQYPREQAIRWLSWLARTMRGHNQSILYLERMQPTWLPRRMWRSYYLIVAVLVGLLVGLLITPGAGMNFGMLIGLSTMLGLIIGGENRLVGTVRWPLRSSVSMGLAVGLASGVSMGLLFYEGDNMALSLGIAALATLIGMIVFVPLHHVSAHLSEEMNAGISVGLSVGLSVAVSIGTIVWIGLGTAQAIVEGLILGSGAGLLSGFTAGLLAQLGREIKVVETLHWSWRRAAKAALLPGLIIGLIVGVGLGWDVGLIWGLRLGVVCGLIVGLTGGEVEIRSTPNQGIRRSAATLLWGIVAGFLVWFGLSVFQTSTESLTVTARTAARGGLIVGLIWGLRGGLVACCQHLVLRLLLQRSGAMPYHYVRFLDAAADLIFLRKVGGGYTFVHDLVQNFFVVELSADGAASNALPRPVKSQVDHPA